MLSALVIGSADGCFEEAQEALKLWGDGEPDAIAVLNDSFPRWPGRVDYLPTLHAENVEGWLMAREQAGYSMGAQVWSYHRTHDGRLPGAHIYPLVKHIASDWAGSSGLYAVRVLLLEKFERIVLAGVPMESKAGHILRKKPWTGAEGFRNGWKHRLPEIKNKVRSCSGWTQGLLGAPTAEWISG
jgi:hypothetical protein